MNTLTILQCCRLAALALGTLLLGSCGGGGGSAPAAPASAGPEGSVVVVGDSLADVGSFGAKATIQNSADPAAGYPLFSELVAQAVGTARQCNYYRLDATNMSIATTPGCRNFAVGGSRIANPVIRDGATVPPNIPTQLAQAVAAAGGRWRAQDLLLVDGGVNDLADLAVTYLVASRSGDEQFRAFLLQQLDATLIDPLLALGAPGAAEVGRLYMQALADTFYAALKTHGLDRGAQRLVVLNIPDITLTPRFQQALAVVAENASPADAEAVKNAFRQWVGAYNAQLQARVAGDARVALVDFYSGFTTLMTYPAQYGLTNVSAASCPSGSIDELGMHEYVLAACTSAALDAAPPAGLAAGWWQRWAFADDFHLTPYGHELLAIIIRNELAETGWW